MEDQEQPSLHSDPNKSPHQAGSMLPTLTQKQRRTFQQQMGKKDHVPNSKEDKAPYSFELSADNLRELQESDKTLSKV